MLDRMRRHKAWLKWSLGIVVVTFVLLYVPSFLQPAGTGAALTDAVATVDGHTITVLAYQRAYEGQVAQLRQTMGDQFNDQMIRQFGIPQRIIQQLIGEEAILVEAQRLGFRVSDAELSERIQRMPQLQENGRFVGYDRYRSFLAYQRPPMRIDEFEESVRKSIVMEKFQAAATAWVRVTDSEADEEYRRRNEKVKLDLAVFTANQFRAKVQATDAELQARYDANQEAYRQPEKRRVRFLAIDQDVLKRNMTATAEEVAAKYQQNIAMYEQPEQVRASHILLKTEGKDDAAVRKTAEGILARVKAGGDFAKLAAQYSEDGSKDKGGDLDFFGRGRMVKEFDEAAFGMKPGQISDLVKTEFGYHIIKVTDRRDKSTRTLADVKAVLEDQIKAEKAQREGDRLQAEVAGEIDDPSDLDRVARARAWTVGDSGLFARDEPLAGLGYAPAVSSEAFNLETGKVSAPLRTAQGWAWITLVETKAAAIPPLSEVKEKVRDDVIRLKAIDLAKARAEEVARAARTNFAGAAKAAGVEVKATELVTRGQALPEVGVNKAVEDAVFALKTGEATGAVTTDNAVVVARVRERTDINVADMAAAREGLRGELLQRRRGEFFGAYMQRAQTKMKIQYHEAAIRSVLGES
jgi:peptidyl-prolyl cis-trans isomerase D